MNSESGKSGFVVVLGRPSTGKSTLINRVCGEKISIVSPVPQTTRNTIRGIYTEERGQIVFLDTPGLHQAEKKINLRMRDLVTESLEDCDALIYTVDTTRLPGEEEEAVAQLASSLDVPRIILLTKMDHPESNPARIVEFLTTHALADLPRFQTGGLQEEATEDGSRPREIEDLLAAIFPLLPEGQPWYPGDHYTDQPPQFRIAEIVREQAILRTRQEVPHAIYVEVADLEQRPKYLWARVFIFVERPTQQGILVGKGAATITEIRRESQKILGRIFPMPVRLALQVKVRPRWRRDDNLLNSLIQ
ncbi:GTP-binding protein Era [Alkalispirochaeta americana]|uniref:GTPase Era n=1 Tax=Alkalispirochaeta americana TaxID=159291 RepID=A0A1N6UEA4_9SPIO|nr:GTPase Era [Alkalispirochaeta americana]SIQ63821.1 GTP-binding protein Era [Alkalispirochaeta americana]